MSYGAQSVTNPCTVTDGCRSTEIVNPAKSRSALGKKCKPHSPTFADADQEALHGETVVKVERPVDLISASFPFAAPSLALSETQMMPTRVLFILIVDDAAMNRDIAGSILRAAGHEVTCVASGAEAIAAVKIKEFDVVLMDVQMPVMDGLEATRLIRGLEERRRLVPIVALNAQDFPEQIVACRATRSIS